MRPPPMKDKGQIEKRLRQAIIWRDKCAKSAAPGYPFWERDVETLKWVLGIQSEKRFLERQGQEKNDGR